MRRTILSLLVLAVLTATAPVRAQDSIEDARAEQEQARRDAAVAAGELDLLAAEDQEVADALADLDQFVAQTEADIEAADQAILAAQRAALLADAEAQAISAEIEGLRQLLRERAVSAYVIADDSQLEVLLTSTDPADAELRQYLLSVANGETHEVADSLRDAEADQRDAEAAAEAARADAEARRSEVEAHLTELEQARAEQAEIQADIERRVAAWEAEVDVLNALDAELSAFIVGEQQRIAAAEEEARRQAEEEARLQAEAEARAEAERQAEEEARRQAELEALPPQTAPPDPEAETAEPEPEGEAPEAEAEAVEPPPASTSYIWPHGGAVVSGFGWRIHPIFGTEKFHSGIDINGNSGDPIVASAAGTVISAGAMGGYGNVVIIDHGGGISTLYAHQSTIASSVGQSVAQGEVIGYVGSTGYSTGPHLHFEVRVDGQAVDPLLYLP